ncbi:MAG: PhoH family protein, partial [Bacteroidales bacterium]|nr:PhoH family protein [Bacteroidales bacterium]
NQSSGLAHALKILDGIKNISVIQLDNSDVIRHKLVTQIINAYEHNPQLPTGEENKD